MKKLIQSTFAMSLMLLHLSLGWAQTESIDDFLGLESEVLPDLKGPQRFSPRDLHEKADWNVQEKEVEIDTEPLKGQGHSLIPWDTLDPQEWLSINRWFIEREMKDKVQDWKIRLRDDRHNEHMGKVLQCHGKCEVFRGTNKATVQHLSRINEGDEFHTGKDSIAWVFLMDGSLVRIGPDSAVSFLEINWSKSEVFYLLRMHEGHVYWHPREQKEYPLELNPETDAISLPLLVREANQTWFERELFQKQNDKTRSLELINLEDTAIALQIQKMNELKTKNNKANVPPSHIMMVAPNGTLFAKGTSFDLYYTPGDKAQFKKRSPMENHEFKLQLRGYNNTEVVSIDEEKWFEIDKSGRSYEKMESTGGKLEITELLTSRIKTIELAREIWMDKYTTPLIPLLDQPKELAVKYGYTIWEEKLSKRVNFLVEYTRRMETTNLKSLDNLLTKLEAEGIKEEKDFKDKHYGAALEYYLLNLKTRYVDKKMQVREMNDLQYYIWILRHGKRKN